MVGHLQANDTEVAYLAASSAALVWMNITSAALYRGFGTALNALCAQAYGARNYHLVGVWFADRSRHNNIHRNTARCAVVVHR